jgi:CheY-like chemotaxis protein
MIKKIIVLNINMNSINSINNINILLIDDNKINRFVFKQLASKHGYNNIYEAENGDLGVKEFQRIDISFDIIFMDVHMPILNGLDATRIIRSNDQNIPIIIITGDEADYIRINQENLGFTNYIIKPINFEEIENVINNHCNNKKSIVEPEHNFIDIELELENNLLQQIIETNNYEITDFFNELHIIIETILVKYDNLDKITIDLSTIKQDFITLKNLSYVHGFKFMGDISKTIEQYIKLIKYSKIDSNFILENILKILEVYKKTIMYINKTYKMNLIYNNPYTLH